MVLELVQGIVSADNTYGNNFSLWVVKKALLLDVTVTVGDAPKDYVAAIATLSRLSALLGLKI